MQAIAKAFASLGISSSSASSSTSTSATDTTNSTQDPQAAMQSFMQSLMAAIQQAGGGNNSMPPPPPGGPSGNEGFTKDQLTSMASQVGSSDSKLSNLVANFDTADTNGDGKLSAQEARAFDKASSSNSSVSKYQGGSNISADIQSLIQQLSSSSSSSSSDSTANSDLQQSFQSLLSALGGSGNSSSLDSFLQTLANNLQGATSTGNVVNTKV